MTTAPKNYLAHLANQEFQWFGTDSLERYNQNLKEKYDLLEKFNWIDYQPFTYKFNQHGFRTAEFTNDPCLVVIGDSNAMGVGVPENCTSGHLVAQAMNLKCYNLGIGGGSGDSAFRIACQWIPKLSPSVVLYEIPQLGRLELLKETIAKPYLPMDPLACEDRFYRLWVTNAHNMDLNRQKNLLAVKNLARSVGAKFVSLDAHNRPKEMHQGVGRDLMHNGVNTHRCIAEHILKML